MPIGGSRCPGGFGGPGGFGDPGGPRRPHEPWMCGPGMPTPRRGCCLNGCMMPFVLAGGVIALVVWLI